MARIEPTVGRVVHFFEGTWDKTPKAAIITQAWPTDSHVSVTVFFPTGPQMLFGVPLWQDGDGSWAREVPHIEWMAYQKGQAAKTEALEAQLGTKA